MFMIELIELNIKKLMILYRNLKRNRANNYFFTPTGNNGDVVTAFKFL